MISRRVMMDDKIVSASGTSLILESVKGSKIPSFAIKGWTKQETTTGAQLFNKSTVTENKYISYTNGGESIEPNFDTNASDYINVSGVDQIYVTKTNLSEWAAFYNSDKVFVSGFNGYGKAISVPEGANYVRFTVAKESMDTFMVNASSAAQPWEPYTGGKPSPSPDYPQEVVSAGEYNEDTQKWEYEIEVGGGNLFNVSGIDSINGIVNNGDGTISITTPSGSSAVTTGKTLSELCPGITPGIYFLQAESTGKDKYIYFGKIWHFGTSMELTEDDLGVPVNLYASGIDTNATVSDIMLNIGSAPLPYEPYKFPQSVTLTSDRPFTKWDRLEKRDGVWGWNFQSAKIMLTGNVNDEYAEWDGGFYLVGGIGMSKEEGDDLVLCKELIYSNLGKYPRFRITTTKDNKAPLIYNVGAADATAFRQWLQAHPLTFVYKSLNETFVPLPESEQAALNALHTYTPTTVITNDQQCEMQITYREWRR